MRHCLVRSGACLPLPLLLSLTGCSWARFDDVEDNPPVVMLKKPAKMKHGFGVFVSTATSTELDTTFALVGGASGFNPAATFNLGSGTNAKSSARDAASCSQDVDEDHKCFLANSAAGLGKANVRGNEPEDMCFVFGVGRSEGEPEHGLIGRCQSTVEYTLPVPPDAKERLIDDEILLQTDPIAPLELAADRAEAPGLVAGAGGEAVQLAWYYAPLSARAVPLVAPGDVDDGYGSAVAVVRTTISRETEAGTRIVAVGAPAAGHVWLFDETGRAVGCLGGGKGFGRTLTSGSVDGDDADELLIAGAEDVTVISGAALAGLAPTADITCSLAALPPGGIIASFGCGSRDHVAGCPGDFGKSLAVGDLDGDGDGEVIVGAPDLRVREQNRAGAVLVFDVESDEPSLLTDQLFLSSSESGDELGTSVAAARLIDPDHDVVLAGAPGAGRTAVFYCSVLNEAGGGRCE